MALGRIRTIPGARMSAPQRARSRSTGSTTKTCYRRWHQIYVLCDTDTSRSGLGKRRYGRTRRRLHGGCCWPCGERERFRACVSDLIYCSLWKDYHFRPLIFIAHCFGGLVVLKVGRQTSGIWLTLKASGPPNCSTRTQ